VAIDVGFIFASICIGYGIARWIKLCRMVPVDCRIRSVSVYESWPMLRLRPPHTYRPVVVYEFRLDGHTYCSRDISPMKPEFRSREECEKYLERFESGDAAQCYVYPRNPKISYLDRTVPLYAWIFGLFGFLFFATVSGVLSAAIVLGLTGRI
jgi:hypothetical protein